MRTPINISIIIPTLNRAAMLTRSINSVCEIVRGSRDIEVLIVDNGSTDGTAEVFRSTAQRYPDIQWKYFYDDMPGLLSGRHLGAREARGKILAYLDDDSLVAPSWLKSIREAFLDPKVVLAGGPSLPQFEVEPPVWLNELWSEFEGGRTCTSLSLIEQGMSPKLIHPRFVLGLNFSIRKQALYQCGGFHPDCIPKRLQRYQGDGETGLALKIKEKGLLALYHPGIAVTHIISASRLTPQAFEQRAFYQGVCDSYTRIRRDGIVPPAPAKSWKDMVRPIKRRIVRSVLLRRGDSQAIQELMGHAHIMGGFFHQHEVRNDPKLLDWVLKPNYFDHALPDGWQDYLNRRPVDMFYGTLGIELDAACLFPRLELL